MAVSESINEKAAFDEQLMGKVDGLMRRAVIIRDEALMRGLILEGMRLYLEYGQDFTLDSLEDLAGMVDGLMALPTNFWVLRDRRLAYVLRAVEELHARVYSKMFSESDARKVVLRLVRYLGKKQA